MFKSIKELFFKDEFILVLIIINAFTIFLEGFEDLPIREFILLLDHFITVLFIVEASLKIGRWGWSDYIESNWNKLDFFVVLVSLPSILLFIQHLWAPTSGEPAGLGFILVFRVSRIFKFFRFLKFIPDIEALLNGIQRALKSSLLILIGFFVYHFIISIVSYHLLKDLHPDYFTDPASSSYEIFKVFTVEGWYEVPDEIADGGKVNRWGVFCIRVYFAVILMTGGIFGLSLVNSIFVDSMVSDNNDDLEAKVEKLNKKVDILIAKLEEKEGN